MPPQIPSSSKETLDHSPPDEATLVDQLNALLSALNIPFTLLSPTDLTPGILIAILESVLGRRIPLIDRRTGNNRDKDSKQSKAAKVQNMKIFLGVLELDILNADVGLSDVDPRRLAEGEWDEIMFVAESLCWMSRRMGLIHKHPHQSSSSRKTPHNAEKSQSQSPMPRLRGGSADASSRTPTPTLLHPSPKTQLDIDAESIFQSGSTTLTGTSSTQRHLFSPFMTDPADESITSLNSTTSDLFQPQPPDTVEYEYQDDESILSALPPFTSHRSTSTSPPPPPSCIHEVPSPSILFSRDQFTPASPLSPNNNARRQRHHSKSKSKPPNTNISFCSECSPTLAQTLPIEHDHPNPSHSTHNNNSTDLSHSSIGTGSTISVRYTGFIEPVDEDSELASFENSRSILSGILTSNPGSYSGSGSRPSTRTREKDPRSVKIEAVKEQFARTQELLNQRAQLLTQLAELKKVKSKRRGQSQDGG